MELMLKGITAALFGLAVLGKLSGKTKSTFDKAGYSALFMYAVAAAEIILIAGLFTPFELYAVLGLLGILAGAVVTLFRQNAAALKYTIVGLSAIPLIVLLFQKLN
jgi:hypothetical protein